jgi:hypothetical protein
MPANLSAALYEIFCYRVYGKTLASVVSGSTPPLQQLEEVGDERDQRAQKWISNNLVRGCGLSESRTPL